MALPDCWLCELLQSFEFEDETASTMGFYNSRRLSCPWPQKV
jgi:hypothetical protein